MTLPTLNLSLQFGDISYAVRHRTALPRHKVVSWIRHSLTADGEITVRIVGAEEGQRLNREFRKKDYATNVLTFPLSAEPHLIGDIIICAPVVASEAMAQGKSLIAHYAHLAVHGILHLHGYDHEHVAQAALMESIETAIVTKLGYADPYLIT